MAREDDFLAAAQAAAQALKTAREALQLAQAAAVREFPSPPDFAPLIEGIVQAMRDLQIPAPSVNVEAQAASPTITVEAAQITVQPAAPAVNNFSPNVVVDVPQPAAPIVNVEAPVVNIEPTVVNVAAPSVRVQVPEPQPPPPRVPYRMTVRRDERTQLIISADIVPVEA